MKLDSNSRTLLAVALAAMALLILLGLLWQADVARLQKELSNARNVVPTHPPTPAEERQDSSSPAEDTASAVPTPEHEPPATESPVVGEFADRNGKRRMTSQISSKIPRVTNKTDVQALVTVLKDVDDKDAIRHEAANILRRSGYQQLTDDVIDILDDPKETERFRAFCVQHLSLNLEKAIAKEHSTIIGRLQRALGDPDIGVRREALLALIRANDTRGKDTAVKWLTQEGAEPVRGIAIRCVHQLNLREHIPTIRSCLRDEDEVIRIAAIVALSQWADEESRAAFVEAADSDSVRLQRAGRLALKRLSEATEPSPK